MGVSEREGVQVRPIERDTKTYTFQIPKSSSVFDAFRSVNWSMIVACQALTPERK